MNASLESGVSSFEPSGLITEQSVGLVVPNDLACVEVPLVDANPRGVHSELQASFASGQCGLCEMALLLCIQALDADGYIGCDLFEQLHFFPAENPRLAGVCQDDAAGRSAHRDRDRSQGLPT